MKRLMLCFVICVLLVPSLAVAEEKSQKPLDASSLECDCGPNLKAIPPILDPVHRHQKTGQFEFSPYAGAYLGDSIGQTYQVGARLLYFFNEWLAFGPDYSYIPLLTDNDSRFGSVIKDKHTHMIGGEVLFNTDAALRVGNEQIEMDFYLTLGMMGMKLNGRWIPCGLIGGGTKVYLGVPWLAFRIDVNSYLHNTSKPGKDDVDGDVSFLGGISILFPNKESKRK